MAIKGREYRIVFPARIKHGRLDPDLEVLEG
jgi:hypothetical protein